MTLYLTCKRSLGFSPFSVIPYPAVNTNLSSYFGSWLGDGKHIGVSRFEFNYKITND